MMTMMDNSNQNKPDSNQTPTPEKLSKGDKFLYEVMSHIACAGFVILVLIFLSGCSSAPKNTKIDDLPLVDTSKPEPFLTRFKPSSLPLGGWLELQETGSYFKPVTRQHPDSALIYFYRPDSSWSQQEIIAANIFLNGKPIDSLKNNHYYPIELPAGSYRLAIRRQLPTPPTSFQKGTVVDFSVASGKTYYLKYAEQYHVVPPNKSLGLLYKRPLIQMPEQKALQEIGSTRLKTQGYIFTKNPNFMASSSLPNIAGDTFKKVPENRLSDENNNQVSVQFKLYNPLTW